MIKVYIEKGISLLIKENEPLKAILEFKNAYKIFPQNFSVLYWMGTGYFIMGSLNAAQFFLKKSLAEAKTLQEKYMSIGSLAMIYIEKREFKIAEGFLRAVLRIAFRAHSREMMVIGYTELARLYRNLKNPSEALFFLKQALALSSDMKRAFILKDMANIYKETGKYKQAVELYKDVMSTRWAEHNLPFYINMLFSTIYAYKKMGDKKKASEFAQRALDHIIEYKTSGKTGVKLSRKGIRIMDNAWFNLTYFFSNRNG
ncbi:MAG: tetratricopeptide repeat protein [Deltaproteobacteria bacterium]|nr:tetratricopeptide repeat protein [Deltaproteobacteria bacterium]